VRDHHIQPRSVAKPLKLGGAKLVGAGKAQLAREYRFAGAHLPSRSAKNEAAGRHAGIGKNPDGATKPTGEA